MGPRTPAGSAALAAVRQLMVPPPSRSLSIVANRKPLVLEEDEWAEALEAIIERDFFPDIPKLQSKLEWLQVHCLPCPYSTRPPSHGSVQIPDLLDNSFANQMEVWQVCDSTT